MPQSVERRIFFRVNSGAIVNLRYAKKFEDSYIVMEDNNIIQISREKKKSVRNVSCNVGGKAFRMILGFCIFFCNFVQAFLIQNFLIKFFGTKSVWGHVARQRLISIVLIFCH